jgi:hypothetical protein
MFLTCPPGTPLFAASSLSSRPRTPWRSIMRSRRHARLAVVGGRDDRHPGRRRPSASAPHPDLACLPPQWSQDWRHACTGSPVARWSRAFDTVHDATAEPHHHPCLVNRGPCPLT